MPRYASVAGRPGSRMRLAPRRPERQLHPDVRARIAVVVADLAEAVAAVEPHRGLEPALAVESQGEAAERARLVEHAGHEPVGEAAPAARRPQPHALELGHLRGESAHRRGPDDLADRVDHHQQDAGRAVVLALPVGHVVVEAGRVHVLAEEREVLGQLPRHPRVVGGAGAADLVVLRHYRFRACASRPRCQRYSVSPRCLPTQRESTKSRSLRRFTYLSGHSPISSPRDSSSTRRSARRHTVRAWWRKPPTGPPPGRTKLLRGVSSFWHSSIKRSRAVTCSAPTRNMPSYTASAGVASSLPRSNSSFCSRRSTSSSQRCRRPLFFRSALNTRASPMTAFSSSMVP